MPINFSSLTWVNNANADVLTWPVNHTWPILTTGSERVTAEFPPESAGITYDRVSIDAQVLLDVPYNPSNGVPRFEVFDFDSADRIEFIDAGDGKTFYLNGTYTFSDPVTITTPAFFIFQVYAPSPDNDYYPMTVIIDSGQLLEVGGGSGPDICFWTEEVRVTETCQEGGGEPGGIVYDVGPNAYPISSGGLQCRAQIGYSGWSETDDVQITRARLFYWAGGAPTTGGDINEYIASADSVEELTQFEDDSSPVTYPGLFLYDGDNSWRFPNPVEDDHEYLKCNTLTMDYYNFMLIYEVTVNGVPFGHLGGYIETPV